MKGCLNFILAAILVCLLAVAGLGIYALFFINRHFYVNEPINIQVPEPSSADKAKLLRLIPVRKLLPGESEAGIAIKLSEDEFNWLANYFLRPRRPNAKVSLKFGQARVSVHYSQKLEGNKYLNIMLDSGLAAKNGDFRVSMESLQIGDWLVPLTLLGQINYLAELYLERGLRIFGIQVLKVEDLRLTADQIEVVFAGP